MVSKVLLLYLFFLCKLSISKRISPDMNRIKSGKLENCQRCKILTDSFEHWLSKTSRGKHEGGDAAWEEVKLKSYSRSEMRLVEIQEDLCSELNKYQDHCYTLAEEAEHVLEKWWFHEHRESVDLYTWLCIENLQYCCPSSHFGDLCKPCPVDKHNKLCSGHGRCDGEGTRKGNGSCICHMGYTGKYCEDCDKNFYLSSTSCTPCHKACDGCSGDGARSCKACKKGWMLHSGSCFDIDECNTPSKCEIRQYCINTEGSYKCENCDVSCKTCKGEGSENCTSCEEKYILWSEMCITPEEKYEIMLSVTKQILLYLGLLTFIVLFSQRMKYFVLFLIIVIYFLEKLTRINILELTLNIFNVF